MVDWDLSYLKALMDTTNFKQLCDTVKSLDRGQQRRLWKLLRALRLHDAVNGSVPPPLTDAQIKAFDEYQPVPIQGKPLSETVIDERR